jgi:hypothetical protein
VGPFVGVGVETRLARSSPAMEGMERALATSFAGSFSSGAESTPRMTPRVRRWRTSARVSRSETTGMPALARKSRGLGIGAPVAGDGGEFADDEAFDVGLGRIRYRGAGSVVADLGVGEDDDLAGIGRIGEDFLIAGEAVLKTTSPERSAGAPKLRPSKTLPSSRARIAEFNSGTQIVIGAPSRIGALYKI